MKKATLEDLLNRKLQAETDRNSFKDIEIPELDITLTFQKLNPKKIFEITDGMSDGSLSQPEIYDKCVELIYTCCPILHDAKLTQGVAEPFEVVPLVFGDNVGAIMNTTGKIIEEFYGTSIVQKTTDELKN